MLKAAAIFTATLAILSAAPARAAEHKFHYLPNADGIPAIPQFDDSNPAAKQDIKQTKEIQKRAHQSWRIQTAKEDRNIDPFVFGQGTLGGGFNSTDLLRAEDFFANVTDDILTYVSTSAPPLRKRPFEVDGIKTCDDTPKHYDYPSPHGVATGVYLAVMMKLFPPINGQLAMRAMEYSEGRIVCGETWPSEINAGRAVGDAIARAMEKNPAFQADYEAARKELAEPFGSQMTKPPATSN